MHAVMYVASIDDDTIYLTSPQGSIAWRPAPLDFTPALGDPVFVNDDDVHPAPAGWSDIHPLVGTVETVTEARTLLRAESGRVWVPNKPEATYATGDLVAYRPHVGVTENLSAKDDNVDVDEQPEDSPFFLPPGNAAVKFDDIGGQDDILATIRQIVADLEDPNVIDSGVSGVLLEGPPGTGKTMLARAIANESKASFFQVMAKAVNSKWINHSEERLQTLFRQAAACENGAVIFFDEIDSIGLARSDVLHSSGDSMLNQLLAEMDGVVKRSNVLVVGATNRADLLDPALLRPGRLNPTLTLRLPDARGRQAILQSTAPTDVAGKQELLEHLSELTQGWSGAEIADIWPTALRRTRHAKRTILRTEDVLISVAQLSAARREQP